MRKGYRELRRKSDGSNESKFRQIPLGLKFQVLFSHPMTILGISFFIMGTIFLVVFGSMISFADLKFSDSSPITTGKIIHYRMTNTTVNDVAVYEYQYSYTITDGKTYENSCYINGNPYNDGDVVNIQYIADNPEISRIQGTSLSIMPFWVLLIIFPFEIIGVLVLFFRIKNGTKNIRILRRGIITKGWLKGSFPTNTSINKRIVYRMIFEFTAVDGNTYEATALSHTPERLSDESEETLVYDPESPEKAVLLDSLPSSVKRFFEIKTTI